MRRLTGNKGLTLVELAIAILVLAVGTVAAMRSFDMATTNAAGLDARMLARVALHNRAAELKLLGPSATLPSQVTIATQPITIEHQQKATAGGLIETTLTARVEGQAGAQIVVYLDPLVRP